MSSNTAANVKQRSREHVETKLIASACKLMAENGPRAVTIRDIAADAGVNHGQIHHYFGGKKGLLTAAMRHLSQEHAEHAARRGLREKSGTLGEIKDSPPPLTLARDKQYQMSIIRSVLDGEMELATLEIDDGVSVPRHLLEELTKALGHDEPTTDIKAALAVAMAIEQAWAALEQYILLMIDAKPDEIEIVRERVADVSRLALKQLYQGSE